VPGPFYNEINSAYMEPGMPSKATSLVSSTFIVIQPVKRLIRAYSKESLYK
jgi:hypothetical protein